jgi:hypothetical protein
MEAPADIELEPNDHDVVVNEWRAAQLERLGLTQVVAQAFANFVDWHELARLVERGCTPDLALQIVR